MSENRVFKLVLASDHTFSTPARDVYVRAGARIELVDGVALLSPDNFTRGSREEAFALSNGFRINDAAFLRIESSLEHQVGGVDER